jgi:enoyl-CoA hydratase
MSEVTYGVQDGVATITLNRPDSRNALNTAMCEGLASAAQDAARDAGVRVVIVRANGHVFCAGADLKERRSMSDDQVRARRQKAYAAYAAIERLPMPSIALVQGAAVGSGCEIAAACDIIIATPAATFRTPEALLGTVGATQRLPRIIGARLAKDLMFTGRMLTADEALRSGLVSRIVSPDQLSAAVDRMTAAIVSAPALALAAAKRCIDKAAVSDPDAALSTELLAVDAILSGTDWRSGLARAGIKDQA